MDSQNLELIKFKVPIVGLVMGMRLSTQGRTLLFRI